MRIGVLILLLMSAQILCHAQASVHQSSKKPNIIVILADDMGFSDLGCYGSEIKTPNIDAMAAAGLRYKQFYNAARCCPTRASLLTGLYPHQAGLGWMTAAGTNAPAYEGNLNNKCVTIAEVLKTSNYNTYMTGKWHVTNERKIDGGIKDNWPKQRGFDKFFGILAGGGNYYTTPVYSDNTRYNPPDNFYLTDAISDTSVQYIQDHFAQNNEKPFFMYVAYTAPHWPLHAPKNVVDEYLNTYTSGWDSLRQQRFTKQKTIGLFDNNTPLTARDKNVPAWNTLTDAEKEDIKMRMAVYAAQIDMMDKGIGKILQTLKQQNQLENTLIFFLSDNGACAEFVSSGKSKTPDGSKESFESYRIHWANVSSTPFKEYKHYTYEGGIATPLIVHWPKGMAAPMQNSFIAEYGHITDIMATCIDVAGATYPSVFNNKKIHALQGKSLLPHFAGGTRQRGAVYWEHEGNIAVRNGKWKLVNKTEEGKAFNNQFQLYDMDADPVEMNDLSKQHPQQVAAMYNSWQQWAAQVGALPLDTRSWGQRVQAYQRNMNGNFDDNLGGWKISKNNFTVTIDETSKISGKKSVVISTSSKPAPKPVLAMHWPFRANKGEQFSVVFKTVTNSKTAQLIVRLHHAQQEELPSGNSMLHLRPGIIQKNKFTSAVVHNNAEYHIAFYITGLQPGEKLWMDDIKLQAF